jgi:signal transduction histidine kinase/hypothetical membrane protein
MKTFDRVLWWLLYLAAALALGHALLFLSGVPAAIVPALLILVFLIRIAFLNRRLQARVEELRSSRQRLVTAQDNERRRLERNLHDGAQQQLVALAVKLRLVEQVIDRDAAEAKLMLEQLHGDVNDALQNLRDLARGIFPPLLADRGLAAALGAQVGKSTVPVELKATGVGRYPQDVEAAAYFCCLEALQNVAKYAHASLVTIRLEAGGGQLRFEVLDDGVGFEPTTTARGAGLQNMADRVEALGGTLDLRSQPGRGTRLIGRIPAQPTKLVQTASRPRIDEPPVGRAPAEPMAQQGDEPARAEAAPPLTTTVGSGTREARRLDVLAVLGIIGPALFTTAVVLQEILRSDRSPFHNYISEYAVGRYGYVQGAAFFSLGLGSFALAVGLGIATRDLRGSRLGSTLLVLMSIGVVLAGVFSADLRSQGGPPTAEGTMHLAVSIPTFILAIVVIFVFARTFTKDERWASLGPTSLALGTVCSVALVASDVVIVQRVFVGALISWLVLTAIRLRSVATGAR